MSWRMAILYVVFFLFAVSVNLSRGQGVVISVSGPPDTTHQYDGGLAVLNSLLAASWTTTGTYSNVNISVDLGANSGATGRAYLTTQIGPGTATNKQVASASFTFPATSSFVSVFAGLNLTAGTYYLILQQTANGSTGDGVWLGTPSPTLVTAANVTANGEYWSYNAIQSYAPATSFYEVVPTYFDYNVTGVSVPEPSGICLFALGSGIVILGFRRKRI
jgi:hypothetical protein